MTCDPSTPTIREATQQDAAAIARALAEANGKADQHLESNTISQNEVVAVWRDAYQKFKTKKGVRCSIENLLKRVLKGNPVGSITPSVDIYNTVSLTHALPVGGEDIDAMAGDIRLGITEGGDAFRPLGEEEDAPTLEGELCYRDDAGAICRCWNWRDGERTALTDKSEGFTHVGPTIVFVVALVLSMLGLSFAVKTLPTGTAYAVWVGIGAALTVIYGMATGSEPANLARILLIAGLVGCVIGLKLVDGAAD